MNKDIHDKAVALNQWILSQDVVKEFQKYEALIHSHPELVALESELKDLQKQIVNMKYYHQDCHELISVYEMKKNHFDQHPIVYNYLNLKQEVNDLINDVQNDINTQLKKRVDER